MLYMCESYIIPFMVKEISAYKAIETDSAFALKRKVKLTEYLDSLSLKLDELREKVDNSKYHFGIKTYKDFTGEVNEDILHNDFVVYAKPLKQFE